MSKENTDHLRYEGRQQRSVRSWRWHGSVCNERSKQALTFHQEMRLIVTKLCLMRHRNRALLKVDFAFRE
jgi:uncharacterized protein YhfF